MIGGMNVDAIFQTLTQHHVEWILIGGMNYLLNHEPVLTYDVDLWIRDAAPNRVRVCQALVELECSWGPTEDSWAPVPNDPSWLTQQPLFCLTSPYGAIDLFREVLGMEGRFAECWEAARERATAAGQPYRSLSDLHMLQCQLALPEELRKQARITRLQSCLS